ncbi:NACHT domain-containing protein [Nocardia salmonicida]|uniref:NACHT domain-containing protein n=1 Tax=Nocardia salmonicida TaxID=53431 RepID=UPI002E285AFD|nr:AAA family ATPase [Nocardia salmonicida]
MQIEQVGVAMASRAGQANEVGSVFRNVVATYFAVFGLASRPIPGLDLPDNVYPVRLDFETADPTDDICVTFSDGRRAFISAKRAVNGGEPLKKTIVGWIGQAPLLGERDLLVIAGEEYTGFTRKLADVLLRRRKKQPMDTAAEKSTLRSLTNLITENVRELVLDRARALTVSGATETGEAWSVQAAMMDPIVGGRNGPQAVPVLAALLHQRAGKALSSDIEEWVTVLTAAGLAPLPDLEGSAGAKISARRAAVDTYLERIASRAGRVDLSLLADDLSPITVDDLLAGMRVRVEDSRQGSDLLRYVRRWRRMLLVGQPGAGKSVALREIAAHCSTHPHAPIPIRVTLPRLLDKRPEQITVAQLIEIAITDFIDTDQRAALIEHLTEAVDSGQAIILCDGLDECGSRAPWMAQQLSDLLEALDPNTGFVLATRTNAVRAAARLELPRAELAPPDDLTSTVDAVLSACAEARAPEADRKSWLAARRRWIKHASEEHDHLLQVPLLAVLLALICADTPDAELPRGRATLLHRAVQQSVERWEQSRHSADQLRPWAPELSSPMLLDGFVVLGRMLDGGLSVSRSQATEALVSLLQDSDRWALSPARAREVADHVLRFWDEHVAVFGIDALDQLSARSKVFVEIATAMWAKDSDEEALRAWLNEALTYTDSDGAIGLAAGLDNRIVPALLELGDRDQPHISLLVAELADRGIVTLTQEEQGRTLLQLTMGIAAICKGESPVVRARRTLPESHRPPTDSADADSWPFVEAACLLFLSPDARAQRAELIARAGLDERAASIAAALCVLTDANTDDQPLDSTTAEIVMTALDIDMPVRGKVVTTGRRRFTIVSGEPLTPGLDRIALAAAHRLDELPANGGKRAVIIAHHSSVDMATRISTVLEHAGLDTEFGDSFSGIKEVATRWLDTYQKNRAELLDDLKTFTSPTTQSLTGDGLWSLTELGSFLKVADYNDHRAGREAWANSTDLRHGALSALADAYSLDKAVIAQQAKHIRDIGAAEGERAETDEWFVAATDAFDEPVLADDLNAVLTSAQLLLLLSCLDSGPDWIAWAVTGVLCNVTNPPWDSEAILKTEPSNRPRDRATLLYLVAIATAAEKSSDLLAWAAGAESADHRIAACIAAQAEGLDPDGSIADTLRRDPDLSVRPREAQHDAASAKYWSCANCRTINDLDTEDCAGCDNGSHPDR